MLHFLNLRKVPTDSINSRNFGSPVKPFLKISYIAEEVVSFEAFRNFSTLLFCDIYRCLYLHLSNFFFAIFKAAEIAAIESDCEIRGFISFCGDTALRKLYT